MFGKLEGDRENGIHLVDGIDELLLLLLLLLLLACLDGGTEGAGMFAVKGLLEGVGKIAIAGVNSEHSHPGDRLEGQPVPAEKVQSGEKGKGFGGARIQSAFSLISIVRSASENGLRLRTRHRRVISALVESSALRQTPPRVPGHFQRNQRR